MELKDLKEAGYKWEVPAERIPLYEERILASGLCDFALDMTFSRFREQTRISYHCPGYVSILEVDLTGLRKLLEILEKTLLTLNKAGEFFIDRDKLLLNPKTVFYNRRYKDVKLAYYPRAVPVPLCENVTGYLDSLKPLTSEKGAGYLRKIAEIYRDNNCDLRDMIVVAQELRRELFLGEQGLLHDAREEYKTL